MTEQPAPEAPPADQAAQPPSAPEPEDKTDWKAEARKWENRAKENSGAAREAEKQRLAAMSDAERAVAEAESKGRTAAAQEYGKRLARSEFDSAAARRNPDVDTTSVLEYVDLTRFLGDDGEPDAKAIKAAVERLIPAPANGVPSFDGGSRDSAGKPADMNSILRKAAGHG